MADQARGNLARVGVPDAHCLVRTARDETRSCWIESNAPHRAVIPSQSSDQAMRSNHPDHDAAVFASGGDAYPIRAEGDAVHRSRVTGDRLAELSTGRGRPFAYRLILARGGDDRASRIECDAEDRPAMAASNPDLAAGFDVPCAHRAVLTAGDDAFAIRA